jgi:uncharacterized membrane protein YphA (DoxX/SURF4 family)
MKNQMFLLGRLIVGGYYLFSAFHHFTGLAMMSQYAAAKGVPAPGLAILVSGVLLAIAGLSFLLGVAPRIGVAALVLFLVPVTLTMHQFWNVQGQMRIAEMVNFTKNLALLGSGLMFLAIPAPWPFSLSRRRSGTAAHVHPAHA